MSELMLLILVLLIGLIAGFFDSLIGAGGLISVPALIFLGIPPQSAIATDRFGTLGQVFAALTKFWKEKKIVWKFVPALAAISLVASIIGAKILLDIDESVLEPIVGILIVIILPLVFLKDLGVKKEKKSTLKIFIGLTLYFLIMVFGGFFGQGIGPISIYVLTFFLGFTILEVIATGIIPWLILSVASTIFFAIEGIIDYKIGLVLLLGMIIGGYTGAHIAVKKGNAWVKNIFIVFVLISAIKLLF